ncbi:MAG: D-glycero-beta-D-manno-heptose-7-phosphate kinase [Candidatus Omnitrophica bacterium]|nr:D-glycero-beta-D-manno-heptose-7-phosphate kinase [Candidatus Omnitrophota bacterium]
MLDEFIWGDVSRISPEAPVPVVWEKRHSYMPGGASNVANNIAALGGQVSLCGVVGKDEASRRLKTLLKRRRIGLTHVITDPARPTTLKTRVVAHHQQLVRIDRENQDPLSHRLLRRLLSGVRGALKGVDAILLEDYGKGVVTPHLIQEVINWAKKRSLIVAVDPKEEHFEHYRGVTVLTPNRKEAYEMIGERNTDRIPLKKVGGDLLRRLKCQAVLITLGEEGMVLFEKNGKITHIPTVAQEVFDVSGAGDTVIGTFTAALAAGSSLIDAAVLSNVAAGIVVGKVGIAVVTPSELLQRIEELRWKR